MALVGIDDHAGALAQLMKRGGVGCHTLDELMSEGASCRGTLVRPFGDDPLDGAFERPVEISRTEGAHARLRRARISRAPTGLEEGPEEEDLRAAAASRRTESPECPRQLR